MNTELSLINDLNKTLPLHLINEILSYRPAHPLTHLMKEARELMIEDFIGEGDLTGVTFVELTTCAEGNGCFKQLIWDDVDSGSNEYLQKYCLRVLKDYDTIQLEYANPFGLWTEEMEEKLSLEKLKFKTEEALANLAGKMFNIIYNVEEIKVSTKDL